MTNIKKAVIGWLLDTLKWVAACALVVTILLAAMVLLPPARAEYQQGEAVVVGFDLRDGLVILVERGDNFTAWYAQMDQYNALEGENIILQIDPEGDAFAYFFDSDGKEVEVEISKTRPGEVI